MSSSSISPSPPGLGSAWAQGNLPCSQMNRRETKKGGRWLPKALACLPEPMGRWFSMIFALLSSTSRGNCKSRKGLQLFPLSPSHLTFLIKNHLFLEQLYTHPKPVLNLNSHCSGDLVLQKILWGKSPPAEHPSVVACWSPDSHVETGTSLLGGDPLSDTDI